MTREFLVRWCRVLFALVLLWEVADDVGDLGVFFLLGGMYDGGGIEFVDVDVDGVDVGVDVDADVVVDVDVDVGVGVGVDVDGGLFCL